MLETIGGTTVILGVIALAISSLLGLVFFVNKEEKFEDVVAAQRKEQEALLSSLQSSGKSSKGNKKWNKIKSKKAAAKKEQEQNEPPTEEPEIDSGVDDEEPSSESVIITQKEEPVKVPDVKPKKEQKEEKKSKKQSKKNKESAKRMVIVEEDIVVEQEEKVEAAPVSLVPDVPIKEAEVIPSLSQETSAAPPTSETSDKTSKKKSKKQPKANKESGSEILSLNKLVSELENSPLNSSEVQQLIDVLLAKQNENEQWHKPKGDPVEAMKKQLSESEMRLHEERQLAQSAALKNKELKNELQQERTQRQGIQQMINQYSKQIKELENACKQSEEKYMSEKQSSQAQITRMQQLIDNESHRGGFHQLAEENQHLKRAQQQLNEEKNQLHNDLNQLKASQQSMKQEYDNAVMQFQQKDQQQKSLQEKIVLFENELKVAQKAKADTESSLTKSLSEVQEKLLIVEGKNKNLEGEVCTLKTQQEAVQKSTKNDDELKTLSQKLLETEAQLSQTQASMKELLGQVDQKNIEIEKKEEEKLNLQKNLDGLKTSADQNKEGENKLATELATLRSSLQDKEAELAKINKENNELTTKLEKSKQEAADVAAAAPVLDDGKLKELEDALAERTEQTKKLEENVESMKKKNNDLREKNWKAMDALSKVEEDSKKKEKSLEITIFKSLKNAHPDLKLPKKDEGLENFFQQFETAYKEYSTEKENATKVELDKLRSENEDLQKRMTESNEQKKSENNQEELAKLATENDKLKTVLAETESMLSRLQSGVDAEVKKWQEKVDTKDKELEELNHKMSAMEDAMKEHGLVEEMETTLKETQKELEAQKEENKKIQKQMEEAQSIFQDEANSQKTEYENKLKETENKLKESEEKLKAANEKAPEPVKDNSEVEELNNKLKKTISERDLAIREYKKFKDTVAKLENDIKKKTDQTDGISETHKKELKKLQDQITALENTAKVSGKDKEKDKLIAGLQKQVNTLASELKQEKEDKFNLSIKLNDLEKSYQEDQSDKDKILNLESKLKAAEAKVAEFESTRSTQIVNEIEDAMQQAAATAPPASDFGTSV